MTGLAGRDVRRALEIFLDFCTSGYIGEDEIYKIRFFDGQYVLPLSVVARVLLRMQRRYYDGNKSHIKNIVQCDIDDPLPDHFVRLSLLHWLEKHQKIQGPAGVIGFHSVETIVRELVQLGHDAKRIKVDLLYLIREGCIVAEHLRTDKVDDNDLLRLTASGLVHLQLMANPDYLAACAEDTWLSDTKLAHQIAARISVRGGASHFSRLTTAKNAIDFIEYLKARASDTVARPEVYLETKVLTELTALREAEAAGAAAEIDVSKQLYVGNLPAGAGADEINKAFEDAGIEIVKVTIPGGSASRENRQFAFVQVLDGRTAMEALDCNDIRIGNRRLVINEAYETKVEAVPTRRPRAIASERLYVGNLPFTATHESIMKLFTSHGFQPTDVFIAFDRQSRRPLGYAFVAMSSEKEATTAIGALNGSIVEGRSITVRYATPRAEKS
jgi:hypothetical protein